MGVGRLAPSPTGAQHLGNARTYLLAYWSARSSGSRIVLRIEDVDSPRVKPWATQQAIDDLRWLGIDWDEGPDIGGPNAPYIQTLRMDRYRDALARLIDANQVFPCICTRKDILEAGSAPHFEHEGPIYPGTCADWNIGDPIPQQGTYCWRFRAADRTIEFDDLLLGRQQCVPAIDLGAFPVTQKNGDPSYQLAVAVDDAEMGITEVVRGDDLVASTFRQIELHAAFANPLPSYAHVPLVRGADGRRLAKRHGDTRLSHFRETGVHGEQVVAWAANSAGLVASRSAISAAEVIGAFSWAKVSRQGVTVDPLEFEV